MAAVDAGAPRGGAAKHKGKKKRMKRIGVRIDMTPMVDVAFLLLTFFMFTTTMTQPQVMEITMPPNLTDIKVPESDLLTLRVRADGNICFNTGSQPAEKVDFKKLRGLLVSKNKENPKLIVSLKMDRHARYQKLIDMLDEINLSESELLLQLGPGAKHERRFSLSTMTEKDKEEVDKL
jgi:biopolymer transport protein ExbD